VDKGGRRKSGEIAYAMKAFVCRISSGAVASLLGRYIAKMRLGGSGQAIRISTRTKAFQSLASLLGAVIGISAIGYITFHFSLPLLLAPFGASAVLLFSVYDSPLAQPRSTVLGHALAAFIGGGIAIVHSAYFGNALGSESYIWIAAAVATSIAAMQFLRLTHPPAGATAFIASTTVSSAGSLMVFMIPVVAGALILVGVAVVFNNAIPSRKYPAYW
jgi:CBS-domain-containing membrane protein